MNRDRSDATDGWVARPRGRFRHYAGLLTPAGAVAARTLAQDRPGQRARSVLVAVDRRRDRTRTRQGGLVVGPGGRIGWRAVPAPTTPGPAGAIVHPLAVATCDMDRPIMLGATPFPLPLHLGHECVAEVTAVGAEVRTVRPGQRVVVPFQISCGACHACLGGRSGNCRGVLGLSMYGFGLAGGLWGGAIADLLAVPHADAMLVPLPDGLEPAAAASVADNVSDAYRHIGPHLPALLRADASARVLILAGLGVDPRYTASMPLYTGMIAVALGARQVDFVDSRPEVRAQAERLGMQAVSPADLPGLPPAQLVVESTGRSDGLAVALRHTAPDGVCSSAGGLHHRSAIPQLKAYITNVTIHIGRTHARAVIPEVLSLMASDRIHPELVTTQVASIDDAPQALDRHCRDGAIKTILTAS